MAIAKLFIDLIGQIAWPLVVLGLGYYYHGQVNSLLAAFAGLAGRVKKVGPAEFQDSGSHRPAPSGSIETTKNEKQGGSAFAIDPLTDDPTLAPWIENVKNLIRVNNLDESPELKERLINALAWAGRHNEFERVGRTIFGSQFAALKELLNSGALAVSALQNLHEEHESRVLLDGMDNALDFLSWIAFLRDHRLATMDDAGRYTITVIGREFLRFAAENGVNESRQY